MIYLPYPALFVSFIAAINWQLWGIGGRGEVLILGFCDFWNWTNACVCNCDFFGFLHLLSLCYWSFFCFCLLHIQNHLDSMQVFSSYFSSKFSLPVWLIGVATVTSFSCPVNYCSYPWSICKHFINVFDLYRHRSKYWTVL